MYTSFWILSVIFSSFSLQADDDKTKSKNSAECHTTYYSIGNMVYEDVNGDGLYNASSENPIANVKLFLYKKNTITNNFDSLQSTFTGSNGLYLFDSLEAGYYIVEIDSTNFDPGQPLFNKTVAPYRGHCHPFGFDFTNDGSNNGALGNHYMFPTNITSCEINLNGILPCCENPNNDTTTTDDRNNLKIDFGFIPPPPPGSCGYASTFELLDTQAKVDSFKVRYPGCSNFRGYLEVNGNDISNLDSLHLLTQIHSLTIGLGYNTSTLVNPLLTSLSGLENLKKLGFHLILGNNQSLTNISALINVDSIEVDLYISNNPYITNLDSLNGIEYIGGSLLLSNLDSLSDIPDFPNLKSIGNGVGLGYLNKFVTLDHFNNLETVNDITIYNMPNLTTISGFEKLKKVSRTFLVRYNPVLDTISGFEMLDSICQNLEIYENPNLAICCGLGPLATNGYVASHNINDNAVGSPCMSFSAIQNYGSCDPVFTINGTNYASFLDAINNSNPGDTIILTIQNHTIDGDPTLSPGRTLVVPSGHTLNIIGHLTIGGETIVRGILNMDSGGMLKPNSTDLKIENKKFGNSKAGSLEYLPPDSQKK